MQDNFLDRLRADHHNGVSADAGRVLDRTTATPQRMGRDPMPIAGRALALVLAVSLTSLSVGALTV